MGFNLRVKSLLLAGLLDLVLAAGIGYSIFQVSQSRFRASFLEQKLDQIESVARLIDGDVHATFVDRAAVQHPEYQRYLESLNRILQEQDYIRYLYTLNYDPASGGFAYAVDAGIAAHDTVWIESDVFALVLTLDEQGALRIQYDEQEYSGAFTVELEGEEVPLSLRTEAAVTEILLGGETLCRVLSRSPLRLDTAAGEVSESARVVQVDFPVAGRLLPLQFSFTRAGESDSMPGVPYIDTPENIARLREILQGGRDFVESEPVRDIYGTSLSLYGIIRNGRGESTGVVEMDIYAGELQRFRRSVAAIALVVAGVTFLIVVAMLHLFTEYLLVPIRRVHSAVQRVSAGRLDVEVHSQRRDELGDLTRGVAAMVRSLGSFMEEQRRDKEQLSQLAFFDVLTGLLNRKSFYDRLEKSLSVAQRAAGHLRALLFLDLDNFKDVNDSLGHEIGDRVLREIAVRISACVRASDYVFRPGGDEFTVLLSALSHETDAAVVAQKLIEAVSRPIEVQAHTLHLSLSVGVALFPRDAQSVEGLVRNADMALFDAKRQRGTYRFFTPQLHEQAVEKMQVVADLHRGLERGEFELHYQPIVAASGEVSGAEALLRWNHPQWGRQGPSRFIALAEEAGLIVPLGEWVIREACRTLAEMSRPGHEALFISVNLSMRQLQEPSLIPAIDRILRDYRFARERLQFELTETLLMQSGQSLETLKALRELGVKLVIDDFGIGYSSLSRLKDLPMHALKVDRSFMAGLSENRKDRELVRAIVTIAHELQLLVVAEGVERPEQVELLRSLGCDAIQGEVYARALPAADFLRFIEEFRAPGPLR